jgi:hypothetical protein
MEHPQRFRKFRVSRPRNPQSDVIAITALEVKMADHIQGESSRGSNQAAGANSLWLKILPATDCSPGFYLGNRA